jgi:hypothetical protein
MHMQPSEPLPPSTQVSAPSDPVKGPMLGSCLRSIAQGFGELLELPRHAPSAHTPVKLLFLYSLFLHVLAQVPVNPKACQGPATSPLAVCPPLGDCDSLLRGRFTAAFGMWVYSSSPASGHCFPRIVPPTTAFGDGTGPIPNKLATGGLPPSAVRFARLPLVSTSI